MAVARGHVGHWCSIAHFPPSLAKVAGSRASKLHCQSAAAFAQGWVTRARPVTISYVAHRDAPRTAWAHWVRETKGRLDAIEPLIPEESVRENDEGRLEVVGWQDEPKATIVCDDGGALLLESVEVAAFQIIELPSDNDGFDRPSDEEPEEQLRGLFHRVRAALSAWMQTLDHLRPREAL